MKIYKLLNRRNILTQKRKESQHNKLIKICYPHVRGCVKFHKSFVQWITNVLVIKKVLRHSFARSLKMREILEVFLC